MYDLTTIIVSLARERIENGRSLMALLYMHKPGEPVLIEFYRDGRLHTVTATLDERSDENLPTGP